MANLGYLQLKSSPGRWLLKLRQGRSDELYDIVSIDGKIFHKLIKKVKFVKKICQKICQKTRQKILQKILQKICQTFVKNICQKIRQKYDFHGQSWLFAIEK